MLPTLTEINSEVTSVSHIRTISMGLLTSTDFHTLDSETQTKLAALAAQILENPIALKRLSEHVLTKLHLDLKNQHERHGYINQW